MKKIAKKVLVATMIASLTVQVVLAATSKQWPNSGSPDDIIVANSSTYEDTAFTAKTSDGNYVVAWAFYDGLQVDIYAQKFSSADGSTVWSGDTQVTNTGGTDEYPVAIIADTNGGAYIFWNLDLGGGDCEIYVQKIDSSGALSGSTVTPTIGGTECEVYNHAISDGSGGYYLAWGTGGPGLNIFQGTDLHITRVNDSGSVDSGWNTGGSGTWRPLQLPESGFRASEHSVQLVSNGLGDVVAMYESDGANFYLATTKFDSSGTIAGSPWDLPLQIDLDNNGNLGRHLISDGSGNIYIGYLAGPFGSPDTVKVQKINSAGTFQWGTGVIVSTTDIDDFSGQPRIVYDGSGGVFIAWQTAGSDNEIYAHHVTSGGSLDSADNWASAPIPLSNQDSNVSWFINDYRDFNNFISDGNGGAYGLYGSYEGGSYPIAKLQHLNSDGSVEFSGDGTTLGTSIDGVVAKMISNGSTGVVLTYQHNNAGDFDLYMQYFDNITDPCSTVGSQAFCGTQTISASTLTFQDIPDSFNFGTITGGSSQDLFSNDNPGGSNSPGADDLLQIYDDRNSGGFTLTVDPDGTFEEETQTYAIPLTNLYLVSSLDETDPGNIGGVTYNAGFSGDQTVSAPLYVDVDSADLTDTSTYTGLAPGSQFGAGPIVLMDGTLPSASGRDGAMSTFTNFYLHIDPAQQAGSYSLVLTYTLSDSTT
ncbi:hypothetical protein KC725_00325 [Candidatus Peregrinibacteria bacterium]|nr:hypothetical protein [Candidatus Peregrinibacteria bacterium]